MIFREVSDSDLDEAKRLFSTACRRFECTPTKERPLAKIMKYLGKGQSLNAGSAGSFLLRVKFVELVLYFTKASIVQLFLVFCFVCWCCWCWFVFLLVVVVFLCVGGCWRCCLVLLVLFCSLRKEIVLRCF